MWRPRHTQSTNSTTPTDWYSEVVIVHTCAFQSALLSCQVTQMSCKPSLFILTVAGFFRDRPCIITCLYCASKAWKTVFLLTSWKVVWHVGNRSIWGERQQFLSIFLQNINLFELLKARIKSHQNVNKYWRPKELCVCVCVCEICLLSLPLPVF